MSLSWVDLRGPLPWLRGHLVHAVSSRDEARIVSALEDADFRGVLVQGAAVRDPASLFDELQRALDLPDSFGHNWDALADLLGDTFELGGRLAVVWRDADQTFAADAQTFVDAVRLLADTAAAVGNVDDDGGVQAQVEIFLLGGGAGF